MKYAMLIRGGGKLVEEDLGKEKAEAQNRAAADCGAASPQIYEKRILVDTKCEDILLCA